MMKKNIIIVIKKIGLFEIIKYYKYVIEIIYCQLLNKRRCENLQERYGNHNRDILFIHIPKAAGMSIVKKLYGINESHHSFARDYMNESHIKFKERYSFSITRNPYDRVFSAYNYLKLGGMNLIDQVWWDLYIKKYDGFESFIINGGLEKAIKVNAEHFIPQYKFVCDINNKIICDYVGKLENLSEVESIISMRLNKTIKFGIENKNVESRSRITSYSNKMKNIVYKLYELDFLILGYEK